MFFKIHFYKKLIVAIICNNFGTYFVEMNNINLGIFFNYNNDYSIFLNTVITGKDASLCVDIFSTIELYNK